MIASQEFERRVQWSEVGKKWFIGRVSRSM